MALAPFFTPFSAQVDKQDPLKAIRQKSWERFLAAGLPHVKGGDYQYVRLRQLLNKSLTWVPFVDGVPSTKEAIYPYILPECRQAVLVFYNGRFVPGLSEVPKPLIALPLYQALTPFGALCASHYSSIEIKDPFALLNQATLDAPLFCYVPPKTLIEGPIQLLHFFDADHAAINSRMDIFVGAHSQIDWVQTAVVHKMEESFHNAVIHFSIEDRAQVRWIRMAPASMDSSWEFCTVHAKLKKESIFETISAQRGAQTLRENYQISLLGASSQAHLYGLGHLQGANSSHVHVYMDHQAPHCSSTQLFKSVLGDVSHSSFEGKIYVHHTAQKTDAFQLNHNLLLSPTAHADSKPNLEIFADDVKASHGATVGKLDPAARFYLEARGIPRRQSDALLVRGFCREVFEKVPYVSIKSHMEKCV